MNQKKGSKWGHVCEAFTQFFFMTFTNPILKQQVLHNLTDVNFVTNVYLIRCSLPASSWSNQHDTVTYNHSLIQLDHLAYDTLLRL